MRILILAVIIHFGLVLPAQVFSAEAAKPAAAPPGIFGEFTLVGGEKVIGLYHPERGIIEVYAVVKPRPLAAKDIVSRRRLSPEAEAEPKSVNDGRARVHTLGGLISDGQRVAKLTENTRAELQKEIQQRRLEISKREEGHKIAEETLASESDRERKVVFAALCTEHLQAIAAGHAAIKDLEASLAAVEARIEAAVAEVQDLQARFDQVQARTLDLEPQRPAK